MSRYSDSEAAELLSRHAKQLGDRGIPVAEACRQLALLAGAPPAARLDRPCVVGDGVRNLDESLQEQFAARGASAAARGRVAKFVPASGAASRMFESVIEGVAAGGGPPSELLENIDRFPFVASLRAAMAAAGKPLAHAVEVGAGALVAEYLLEPSGLGYRMAPKGMLEFHSYDGTGRTAFEEQLVESVRYVRDREGICRLHFTVSEGHESLFRDLLLRLEGPLRDRYSTRFEVSFSIQSGATDTLAVDLEDRPFLLDDGTLLLRPGGHGALIRNLGGFGGDIAVVKNIDNVVRERGHGEIGHWKSVLVGLLSGLQERVFELLEDLEGPAPSSATLEAGLAFVAEELLGAGARGLLAADPSVQRRYLLDRLQRPMRVCGVVRNEGEPGGAPFWVSAESGEPTPQIVEQSQIDLTDESQRAIFESSTHFNPVDLACALRDRHGRAFDLESFVDPSAVFISRKSLQGRPLKALERPGLWNGAMARWITIFVEVPIETFAPVKTVFDLLRPAHQPAEN